MKAGPASWLRRSNSHKPWRLVIRMITDMREDKPWRLVNDHQDNFWSWCEGRLSWSAKGDQEESNAMFRKHEAEFLVALLYESQKNCVYTVGNTIHAHGEENNWHQGRSVGYLFSEQPIRIFPRISKNISPFGRFFRGLFLRSRFKIQGVFVKKSLSKNTRVLLSYLPPMKSCPDQWWKRRTANYHPSFPWDNFSYFFMRTWNCIVWKNRICFLH